MTQGYKKAGDIDMSVMTNARWPDTYAYRAL